MNKELINCKVAVIDEKGIIHVLGRVNDSTHHLNLLLGYFRRKYPNINIENLTIGNARDTIGYQFGLLGNVIYYNDINYGLFYFPNNLSAEQVNILNNLNFGNKKMAICYNGKKLGNRITYPMIGAEGDLNLQEVMDVYINRHSRLRKMR